MRSPDINQRSLLPDQRWIPIVLEDWTEDPEVIPCVQWSDVMLYMVTTPSPYTREEIKVSIAWYWNFHGYEILFSKHYEYVGLGKTGRGPLAKALPVS